MRLKPSQTLAKRFWLWAPFSKGWADKDDPALSTQVCFRCVCLDAGAGRQFLAWHEPALRCMPKLAPNPTWNPVATFAS